MTSIPTANDFGDGYMVGMERFGEGRFLIKTDWRASGTARCCNAVCGTGPDRLTMPAFVGTIQGNQLIIKVLVSKPQVPSASTPDQNSCTPYLTREQRSRVFRNRSSMSTESNQLIWKDIVGVHGSEATPDLCSWRDRDAGVLAGGRAPLQ